MNFKYLRNQQVSEKTLNVYDTVSLDRQQRHLQRLSLVTTNIIPPTNAPKTLKTRLQNAKDHTFCKKSEKKVRYVSREKVISN